MTNSEYLELGKESVDLIKATQSKAKRVLKEYNKLMKRVSKVFGDEFRNSIENNGNASDTGTGCTYIIYAQANQIGNASHIEVWPAFIAN